MVASQTWGYSRLYLLPGPRDLEAARMDVLLIQVDLVDLYYETGLAGERNFHGMMYVRFCTFYSRRGVKEAT